MPIRMSNRALLLATASFVFALGAVVGPTPRQAFAQATKTKDKSAPAAPQSEPKSEDEPTNAAPAATPAPPHEEEHKSSELDTSAEIGKAVYVSGDIAFTRSDLGGISDNTGFDRTVANGMLYGLSTGLRLKDLRFGLRWRVYDTTEFQLWTFALSAGYGLPLRPVSPVFSAHVGYVYDQHVEEALFKSSMPPGSVLPANAEVKGLLTGVDVNASYWVTRFLRLGVFIGADLMFLSREQAALPYSIYGVPPEFAARPLYSDSGSGIGLNVNAGLRGAFDIGFK